MVRTNPLKAWQNVTNFRIYYLFNFILTELLSILVSCTILYEHSNLHLLYYTWFGYITSWMEHRSHKGIEPLKAKHNVTKLDFTFLLLSLLCINIDLIIQAYITCFVHDLNALGVAQKIQVICSLQYDK